MKKVTAFYIEEKILQQLDALRSPTVSRNQLVNSMLVYLLQSPETVAHIGRLNLKPNLDEEPAPEISVTLEDPNRLVLS